MTEGRPRVVAVGDSVTLGVGDGVHRPGSHSGWAFHVATALGASQFVNLAANGVRARHLGRAQVPTALMHRPDVVLMTVGGNDALRGDFDPAEVTAHLAATLTRLRRPGRHVVIVTLDHIGLFDLLGRHVRAVMARRIGEVNTAIKAAIFNACAADGDDVVVIDGAEVFRSLGPQAWHVDRIHPSAQGHRAIAARAVEALRPHWTAVASPLPAPQPPGLAGQAWWLVRNGMPWIAKRSRDLIPQVALVVTHELLEERRRMHKGPDAFAPGPSAVSG